jgi:hypothetical protein
MLTGRPLARLFVLRGDGLLHGELLLQERRRKYVPPTLGSGLAGAALLEKGNHRDVIRIRGKGTDFGGWGVLPIKRRRALFFLTLEVRGNPPLRAEGAGPY